MNLGHIGFSPLMRSENSNNLEQRSVSEIAKYLSLTKLSEVKLVILDQNMYVDPTKTEDFPLKIMQVIMTEQSLGNFSNLVQRFKSLRKVDITLYLTDFDLDEKFGLIDLRNQEEVQEVTLKIIPMFYQKYANKLLFNIAPLILSRQFDYKLQSLVFDV